MLRRFSALVVLCFLLAPLAAIAQPTPPPLDYRAYDGWNAIRSVVLAEDGSAIAYSLVPEDGDATLVVRTIASGRETREPRGLAPQFTADGKFLVYTIAPLKTDLDAAKKAKKKPEDSPKNGLGVLDLTSGTLVQFERIKDAKIAKHGGRFIAFLAEPKKPLASKSDAPSAAPSNAPNPAASAEPNPAASASASPAPSPSPTPDAKKKDDGTELTIRDLQTGTNVSVANVSDYAISADDRSVAYATQSKDGKADGMHVRALDGGAARDLAVGPGHFTNVTFSPEGAQLAYLSDASTYASDAPHYALFALDAAAAATPVKLVDAATDGLPTTLAPSTNGTLAFTKDGKKLFLGTAAVPTPQPMNTPEPMGVDLWSYRDSQLQSVQKHDADIIAKRTLRGVVDLATGRYVQLASSQMRTVIASDEPGAYALGIDSRAYDTAASWRRIAATIIWFRLPMDRVDLRFAALPRTTNSHRRVPTSSPTTRKNACGVSCVRATVIGRRSPRPAARIGTTNSTIIRLLRRLTVSAVGWPAIAACCSTIGTIFGLPIRIRAH